MRWSRRHGGGSRGELEIPRFSVAQYPYLHLAVGLDLAHLPNHVGRGVLSFDLFPVQRDDDITCTNTRVCRRAPRAHLFYACSALAAQLHADDRARSALP